MKKVVNLTIGIMISVLTVIIITLSVKLTALQNESGQLPTPTTTPEVQSTLAPIATPTPTVTPVPTSTPEPQELEIHQIAVGCADAFLIRTNNTTIMVDGGLDSSKSRVFNYLDSASVTHIDAYIATHWHGDHVGNMNSILSKYADEETLVYGPSQNVARKYSPITNGRYIQMLDGNEYKIGDISLFCVGPTEVSSNGTTNSDSLNFVIQFGNVKALFTGDYLRGDVVQKYPDLTKDVDIFKFPHHGLKKFCMTANSLRHINPTYVMVPSNDRYTPTNWGRELGVDFESFASSGGNHVFVTNGEEINVYSDVEASAFAR